MKEVTLGSGRYRLFFNKVGFWIDAHGKAYLANPTDVSYLSKKHGVKTVNDKKLVHVDEEMSNIWEKKVIPALKAVLKSDYIPCSEFKGTNYWTCAETPYFGVQILHADKFIGQKCGIFELSKEEFKAAMKADCSPWAVQEIETPKYHFWGNANQDWMIYLK